MFLVIGPAGLLFLVCLAFRPLRRLIGYVLLVLLVIGIGAFGHVQFINDHPWVPLLAPLALFLGMRGGLLGVLSQRRS